MTHRPTRDSSIRYYKKVSAKDLAYPVHIGEQLQGVCLDLLKSYPKIALITNDTILNLYGRGFIMDLEDGSPDIFRIKVKDGEEYKNIDILNQIYLELAVNGLGRDGLIIALGGGVIGDLAGFAAATFMRGLDYIQVPTTLLAMVDSSIGGKTGINLPLGKNMVGSFHQPRAVFSDLDFLDTLPIREFRSGLMEVIKYGLTLDSSLYAFITENKGPIRERKRDTIAHLIYRSCRLKGGIVCQDERDTGIRSVLNFGHTVGHALESYTHYDVYLHGEAVALGSLVIIRYLVEKGVLDRGFLKGFEEILEFFELPTSIPARFEIDQIMRHLSFDKKRLKGENQWVTLRQVGSAAWKTSINKKQIKGVLKGLQKDA